MRIDPSNSGVIRTAFWRSTPVLHRSPAGTGGLLIAVVLASWSSPAVAQQYKTDPVDDKALRTPQSAQLIARGAAYTAAERPKVEEYFVKGFFPDMTRHDPASLGRIGDKRDRTLFGGYLWRSSNPQFQGDVTKWAFDAMKRMASPGYHPAVRYNAVLIIGMLDQEYAIDAGANRRPPKPLPQANDFLLKIVNAGAAGSKVVTPPLLAGALVGLERHARFRAGLPREAPEAMTAAVLKIVAQDKPTMDMTRDVHAWMRLKAAGVLADLGAVGTNNQVHDALVKLIAESRWIDDRCAAAALLEKINYEGAKVDGATAAKTMLTLARDVAEAEAKRAEEYRDVRFSGGGGVGIGLERGGGRGRFDEGGGGFTGEEQPEDFPRRLVLARLSNLKTGIEKLKPVVPEGAQKKFDAIVAALDPAIDAAANKDIVPLNVASAIVNMGRAITAVTGATEAAAAVTEDAGFDMPAEAPVEAKPAERAPAEPSPAEAPPADAPPAEVAPAEAAPAAGQ